MNPLLSRCRTTAAGGLALMLAGCGADTAMLRADWSWWNRGRDVPDLTMSAAPPGALVDADGRCPDDPAQPVRGVGLGMTECDLVRQAGPTDRIEIGTDLNGRRTAVITYPQGERAGIYRFSSGLLVSVERVAETAAQKPQRRTRGRPPS